MSKIGVFICHCGENISATVDCEKVAEAAKEMEGVAYAIDYKYMCSDPGQTLIKNAIKEYGLDGVVVAACSPRMHEPTFRRACAEAGLNPYLCEIANIREHCSWVHEKGGQRQRIMLAVAAMLNKPLIIIDEPTSALDAGSTGKVLSFFRRQAEKGTAVLAVSHDNDFALGCHYLIEL